MRVLSWNVNGIRSVFKNKFIDFIKERAPDILCIQEIKAEDKQIPGELIELEGYKAYINSSDRKGYSGTMVFSKKEPNRVEYGIGFERFDKEGRVIVLEYEDFILINLYLPHGGRDKSNLEYKLKSYDALICYLKKSMQNNVKVLLIGDFNIAREDIDLARPKNNKNNIMFTGEERAKIQEIIDLGFVDCFRKIHPNEKRYSWWPYMAKLRERNVGWRIDYVFASENMFKGVKDSLILNEVFGSDHCPIGVEING